MKVFVLAGFAESLVTFRGDFIRALSRMGAEVHLGAPGLKATDVFREGLGISEFIVHDIPLRRTGLNPWLDMLAVFALIRVFLKVRPDVVLSYTIKPVVYGSIAAWICGIPKRFALVTGLGYAFQTDEAGRARRWLRRLVTGLYRFALKRVEVVFFQNPDDERLFRDEGILAGNSRTCIVNGSGVNLCQFDVAPLPKEQSYLLIGRLLGSKGVREYVKAARRVKNAYPSARFAIVGWVDENPDAIRPEELDSWVAEGVVEYLGRMADVRGAIADSSVYVLPSYREGTPRTVLEAMAMGRAVITTDAPGCRETVVDGDNGFLVPVKAVDELVKAMVRFIEDPELGVRMGRRSRQIAEERYDVHRVNGVMLREMGIQ